MVSAIDPKPAFARNCDWAAARAEQLKGWRSRLAERASSRAFQCVWLVGKRRVSIAVLKKTVKDAQTRWAGLQRPSGLIRVLRG